MPGNVPGAVKTGMGDTQHLSNQLQAQDNGLLGERHTQSGDLRNDLWTSLSKIKYFQFKKLLYSRVFQGG